MSIFGDPTGIRTPDPLLKRQLLCRLSYRIVYANGVGQRSKMAGTAGFEPAGEGVKVPCLTTWRRPNVERNKGPGLPRSLILCLGWVMGLEPTTPGTTIRCSAIELHPPHLRTESAESSPKRIGTPEGTRTPGPLLRRQLLYPAELLAHNLERVTRIELASPAWKAGALTIVLHPHSSPTDLSPQQSSALS